MKQCMCRHEYDNLNREWVKRTCPRCQTRKAEAAKAAVRNAPIKRLQLLEDIHG
ncbi:hypothetical protein [Kosakonia virus Kc318]|uniref:Uncharacterized protein n=1 Tax=Kosakonia virus Kc318 TaxID=2797327 RepID=A0AAE7PGC8_9CAUD|nr:hypothetical protein [Kosakonia virus Kc318]